ncbi:hypothetical protein ACI77N_18260 [Pseudomonas sp. S191]|uniref:hypothetical protein n=1 Tax=Pseudomonas sp. S191 TaxID=579575 RepID=UPI00387AB7DF
MSTNITNRLTTADYFSTGRDGDTVTLKPVIDPSPSGRVGEAENSTVTGSPRQWAGQLAQVRLGQPFTRERRAIASASFHSPAEAELKSPGFPASEAAKKADERLQKNLVRWLITSVPTQRTIPNNSSIKPFIDAFNDAVRAPQVMAWFSSKGLDLSTVRVFSDAVEGTVIENGEKITRRFTFTDGLGWGAVGAKVAEAVSRLSPDNYGVLLPDMNTGEFRSIDAILDFYAVAPPSNPEERAALGKQLRKQGWPPISEAKRNLWRGKFNELVRANSDINDRIHTTSQLQTLVQGKGEGETLDLGGQLAVVSTGSTLTSLSQDIREFFVNWLARPAFKTFIDKSGLGREDSVYRVSDGNLEIRDSANKWRPLQRALEDEISKVQVGGSAADQTAITTLSNDFQRLVALSKSTGNALYSRPMYDVRQVLAYSGLGAPSTVAQVKSAIASLSDTVPPSSNAAEPVFFESSKASSNADRLLQLSLGGSALMSVADKNVQLLPGTTIFPLYDAYRAAFNTLELKAWFLSKGMALSSVVIKPDSVSGMVTRNGVTSMKTFTTSDGSGWWQASTTLRIAAQGLDPRGRGIPYASDDNDGFSRDVILRWYGVQPPASDGKLTRAKHDLLKADWFALPPAKKAERERRVETSLKAIDSLDQRAQMTTILTTLIADKPDGEAVALRGIKVPINSASAQARIGATEVQIEDLLRAHGMAPPKTVGALRNIVQWLTATLAPPPPQGNYSQLLSSDWAPGYLSAADKTYLAHLSDEDSPRSPNTSSLLRVLDVGGILEKKPLDVLRNQADRFLDKLLGSRVARQWGDEIAGKRNFRGASGTTQLTAQESAQWVIAAVKLQIDPDSPGRPGTVAGFDIYQAGNSGKSMAQLRADIEAHLMKNKRLDPKAAALVAHLFLASAAPELLVRDIPATLRVGSMEWSDLRLGVAMAERLGGAGSSRAMSYKEIMSFSRLSPRTEQEAAVLDNYGVDILMEWGLMQGLYTKAADGRYTPQQHELAAKAFDDQRKQLVHALKMFVVPVPNRKDLAMTHLQKEFANLSVEQLLALRVGVASQKERRNMKGSEPTTRSLVETYMTGDLKKGCWMLLAPGEEVPQPPKQTSPFDFNRGLSKDDQAAVDKNVVVLDAKIANLPNIEDLLPGEVDTYLNNLKEGLSTVTKRMIADLSLPDRQALEFGEVKLFTLREQVDLVPTLDQTAEQREERRGRKGTLISSKYEGTTRYFEVFPDKMLIVKRGDLPEHLTLDGSLENVPKTYGPWAPTITQLQNGAVESFDFKAYSSSASPRPGATSPGIIIEQLGGTLQAPPEHAGAPTVVPDSFASARTQSIVERIMQGNFVHHRDTVLKAAKGELPLEEQRTLLSNNKSILLSMIPFVGAMMDFSNGKFVEGTKGLIVDTAGALIGGAASSLKPLIKSTKVIAPFGAKAFQVLEKGVVTVSAFLNPLDGSADLLVAGTKGILALPKLLAKSPQLDALAALGAVEEKLRTYLAVSSGVKKAGKASKTGLQSVSSEGEKKKGDGTTTQVDGFLYVINPRTGLPMGTPLDVSNPLSMIKA